jgi:NitT/TauT family transport system substrate-binding protein
MISFRKLAFLTAIACGFGLSAGFWGCGSGKMETLTVAVVPTELNALFYVAEAQKYFAANGLQVTLKDTYDSGASAAAGMLKGETDIALAAEFPLVREVFNKKEPISFGTVTKYENTYLICRSDSGIRTIRDLKGKKVGVTLKTISEFYLGRMLDLHGLSIKQIHFMDVKAPEAEKAITVKAVDAVVTWEPWAARIRSRLGKEAITMPLQGGQYAYWNLVSTSNWIKKHPKKIERLMKSLSQAESYLVVHPGEAKAIVRERMKFDEAYLETIWPRYQFALSLDQSLITAMEDEARWMIANSLTTEKKIPDFLNSIAEDGLKAVKPAAVSIIR